MKYILLVIGAYIPYLMFPLGVTIAVLIIKYFVLKSKRTIKISDEENSFTKNDLRMKKWNSTLNTIMIISVAVTIIRAIVDYIYLIILRPDMYAITSFPWYTNSLMYGVITLMLLLICVVIKAIIRYKTNKAVWVIMNIMLWKRCLLT